MHQACTPLCHPISREYIYFSAVTRSARLSFSPNCGYSQTPGATMEGLANLSVGHAPPTELENSIVAPDIWSAEWGSLFGCMTMLTWEVQYEYQDTS